MRKTRVLVMLISFLVSGAAMARDDRNRYSIEDAMNTSKAKEKLDQGYVSRVVPPVQRL